MNAIGCTRCTGDRRRDSCHAARAEAADYRAKSIARSKRGRPPQDCRWCVPRRSEMRRPSFLAKLESFGESGTQKRFQVPLWTCGFAICPRCPPPRNVVWVWGQMLISHSVCDQLVCTCTVTLDPPTFPSHYRWLAVLLARRAAFCHSFIVTYDRFTRFLCRLRANGWQRAFRNYLMSRSRNLLFPALSAEKPASHCKEVSNCSDFLPHIEPSLEIGTENGPAGTVATWWNFPWSREYRGTRNGREITAGLWCFPCDNISRIITVERCLYLCLARSLETKASVVTQLKSGTRKRRIVKSLCFMS